MTSRNRLIWLQWGLLVVGLALLAVWSETYAQSRRFQTAGSSALDRSLAEAGVGPSSGTSRTFAPPLASIAAPGAPELVGVLGRLEIPRLRIAAIVAEGSDAKTLRRAVGHIASTALPGQPGNCALAGHRDTFLRELRGVRVNDLIRVVTLERTYAYRVEWTQIVAPRHVEVLDSTATPSLTLVTCYPFTFVGHAPQRFVVRATQVENETPPTGYLDRRPSRISGLAAARR